MNPLLFERDLLYPTSNIFDPGIIHVKILNPTNASMPVIVEPKSSHSTAEDIGAIIDTMQKDIFDRINIKVDKNTTVYILINDIDSQKYKDGKYLKVIFESAGKFRFETINEI
jgi:hypothetical protein